MNIVKTFEQYNSDFVYFCEPIKNNIMNEGNFIRIIYSTPFFVLNGIYLFINISNTVIEKYYNKYKCCFDVEQQKEVIENIYKVEESILKKANISNKIPQFKIYDQLKNGNIKIFIDNIEKINGFALKIAGLWETDTQYGLTYKFVTL
jgi:hypothetical protein